MTRDDAEAFAKELILTAELFAAPLSEARITAYFQALEDVPWPELRPALIAARQCERWFPTPAALRELLDDAPDALAGEAFAEVWRCASNGPSRRHLDMPAREAVEAMGGWGTFREAKTGSGSMLSAQFRKLYLAFARRARVESAKARAITAPDAARLEAGR